jgi:HPt (histidine-containing phosphotransfer) domain-containing protein
MDWSSEISEQDIEVFLLEVDEFLQLLGENFVKLEQESSNAALLQEIFRAAHTLKGSAGMLGFKRMADLAHVMETLLDRVRPRSQLGAYRACSVHDQPFSHCGSLLWSPCGRGRPTLQKSKRTASLSRIDDRLRPRADL